ncbi:MAG: hypothetical protein LC687_05030 [Actinobacteria bacterium]|nr:hypothetical protein [Actinomycetota bacterium]MCA1807198.1 hypothetical protein [Actinomycetota bacterium]
MSGFWRKPDPRSEYEGRGPLDNTLFPKGPEALNAHDKLRLQSLTGQEEDPLAPRDPYFWQGGVDAPEPLPGLSEAELLDLADPYPKGY